MGSVPQLSRALILTVIVTFLNHLFSLGLMYSFGPFLPPIKFELGVSLDAVTAIGSIMIGMQFLGSLLAGILIPGYMGHSSIHAVGGLLALGGFLVVASADDLEVMYTGMGLMVGLGLGAANLAALTSLNAQAKEHRVLVVGIAACGTSAGTIVLPPIYTKLIDVFGWRWALRMNGLLAGMVLVTTARALRVEIVDKASNSSVSVSPAGEGQRCRRIPCADPRFLCWFLNKVCCFLGYFSPIVLLAQFAIEEHQLSPSTAAAAYSIMGICALTTRASLGCITVRCGGPRKLFLMAQLGCGLLTVLLPFCQRAFLILGWSALFGLCVGPFIALVSVCLSELFGVEKLPLYHGCSRLGVALGTFAGPPMIARLAETFGYHVAFGIAGALVLSGTGFILVLEITHTKLQLADVSKQPGSMGKV